MSVETPSKYTCNYCNREYKRKIYFDRHILICETLFKSKREKLIEEQETDDTPDIRKLYDIILELSLKCNKLEKKVEFLSNEISKNKKKKINFIHWLCDNYKNGITPFHTWLNTIDINRKDLELIFEYNFIDGIKHIIYKLLPIESIDKLPIKCFDERKNKLFIFVSSSTESDSADSDSHDNIGFKWVEMNRDDMNKFINIISRLIMREFVKWQEENKHKIHQDDYANLYAINVQKAIGAKYSKDTINSKTKSNIYNHLKLSLNSIIEYEFEF